MVLKGVCVKHFSHLPIIVFFCETFSKEGSAPPRALRLGWVWGFTSSVAVTSLTHVSRIGPQLPTRSILYAYYTSYKHIIQ
jgi:hypothetical protein